MNDKNSIGGSEIAAILGLSPWRTALDVWREKVLGAEPQPDSPALALGRRFEAALLEAYRETLPAGSELVTSQEPYTKGHHRYSPDAIATVHGWQRIVEAKTTGHQDGWGEPGTDQIPIYYRTQVMWGMHLYDIARADVPMLRWPNQWEVKALVGMSPAEIVAQLGISVYSVDYDPKRGADIQAAVDAFWHNHVIPQVPPPAASLEDARRLVWDRDAKSIPVTDKLDELLAKRRDLHARIKVRDAETKLLEDERERVDLAILAEMGTATNVVGPDGNWLVQIRTVRRKGHVVQPSAYTYLAFPKEQTND